MKYVKLSLVALCFNSLCSLAYAGTMGPAAPVNETGFFVGIGASYNYGQLDSDLSVSLNAASGVPPLGVFTGTAGSYNNNDQAFAPEAQVGYFKYFNGSQWLWGLEFLYQYSNLEISTNNVSVLVANPFVNVTDFIRAGQIRTNVDNTLMLPVFIGHSFMNGFVYAGVGPALFDTTQTVSNSNDIFSALYIGNINKFSESEWIWGGVAQAGIAYYVNPTWFLKLNYSCAFTGNYNRNNTVAYAAGINNGLNSGTMTFNTQENLVTQEVALSINKVFSL